MQVVTQFSDLDLTKQYTYSDYLQWQFSERVELIKGFIRKMSPAPNRKHQTISQNLNFKIYSYRFILKIMLKSFKINNFYLNTVCI